MSAKKKKVHSPWLQCDNCGATFSFKDNVPHTKSCPPLKWDTNYSYVFNRALHTKFECLDHSDTLLQYVPSETRDRLCLMSEISLQLTAIPFGNLVLITNKVGKTFLRTAWKASEKQILSVAFTENDPILRFETDITVERFDDEIQIAQEVIVEAISSDWNNTMEQLLLDILSNSQIGQIFRKNDIVEICVYGKKVGLKIISIQALDDIECDFHSIQANTVWKLKSVKPITPAAVDKIGGLRSVIEELEEILLLSLNTSSSIPDLFKPRGILLHGLSGTGKSTLMENIAKKTGKSVVKVPTFKSQEDWERNLETCYLQAVNLVPSIITIDDIDVMCSKNTSRREQGRKNVSCLSLILDRLHQGNNPVVILATTRDPNMIDKSLRRPGRFDKEIELPVPSPLDREDILKVLLNDAPSSMSTDDIKQIADSAHGFVGADLLALSSKAVTNMLRSSATKITAEHFQSALPLIKPSAMKEVLVQVPNVRWEDIGGQDSLKHQLRQAIEWPLKHGESFKRLGISPPRGLLMYGPPGCSKTMIAKALATETGLNFISIKGPELFSKWVGESEKAVREVFKKARQAAPSIVFFDELDALAGERSSSSGGSQVQERVLAQLLTELDGVEALGAVTVVGATNRPDRIDPALLRPGRLDRVVYVPLPDRDTRRDIFAVQFRTIPVAYGVDPADLAKQTDGYSGAEVVAVCYEAAMKALDENKSASVVNRTHFESALQIVKPRTPLSAIKLCEAYGQIT